MVDYSRWKNIEISDDEDDTHPNIDTASLFRWRHQARVERMEQRKIEEEELKKSKLQISQKINELNEKNSQCEDNAKIEDELKKLKLEKEKLEIKEREFHQSEKTVPWNVDTISKESWSKTIFNKPKPREDRSNLSDAELEIRYKEFVKKYESKIKEYAMLSKFDDCKNFLMQNQDLVCEETSNYLTFWCLNLAIEGKNDLMNYISKQAISLHYILELSKQMDIDPRGCVSAFFNRIQKADKEYQDAYDDEVNSFRERIKTRAQKKIEEAMKEVEEEERLERLGPGGLDPEEVFNSLPEVLQKCFESRDIESLQKAILTMDPEDAKYHMKRCVDSGLWVPSKDDNEDSAEQAEESATTSDHEVQK